jgi:hypothetical protein
MSNIQPYRSVLGGLTQEGRMRREVERQQQAEDEAEQRRFERAQLRAYNGIAMAKSAVPSLTALDLTISAVAFQFGSPTLADGLTMFEKLTIVGVASLGTAYMDGTFR